MAWMFQTQTETETEKLSWHAMCCRDDLKGRWVALDQCRYDEHTGCALEGAVVDSDDNLAELCQRISESPWKGCAILFCDAA
ncbi:MAG: hypothetical protein IPK60_23465 [Sandaracinaceae bacterium]|jgi:hypothetical protein|nr:hypothetical protein [Sandaracinaceae bacterium]